MPKCPVQFAFARARILANQNREFICEIFFLYAVRMGELSEIQRFTAQVNSF